MKPIDELKLKNGDWRIVITTKTKYERYKYFIKKITKNKVVFNDLWCSWWGDMTVLKKDILEVK